MDDGAIFKVERLYLEQSERLQVSEEGLMCRGQPTYYRSLKAFGHIVLPKPRKSRTKVLIRLRSECSTLIKEANPNSQEVNLSYPSHSETRDRQEDHDCGSELSDT